MIIRLISKSAKSVLHNPRKILSRKSLYSIAIYDIMDVEGYIYEGNHIKTEEFRIVL